MAATAAHYTAVAACHLAASQYAPLPLLQDHHPLLSLLKHMRVCGLAFTVLGHTCASCFIDARKTPAEESSMAACNAEAYELSEVTVSSGADLLLIVRLQMLPSGSQEYIRLETIAHASFKAYLRRLSSSSSNNVQVQTSPLDIKRQLCALCLMFG